MFQLNRATSSGINIRGLIVSLLINAVIPFLLFTFLTRYESMTAFTALSVTAIIPLLSTGVEVIRNRRLDLIAIFSLLGTLTGIIAIFLGGDARLLIVRESLFTGVLGLTCFVSLLLFPRPLMFYIIRQVVAGNDVARIQTFNRNWRNAAPRVRSTHRVITTVWGCVFLGEFLGHTLIAYTLPIAVGLVLGSTLFTGMMVATTAWTFAYARWVQRRVQQEQVQ